MKKKIIFAINHFEYSNGVSTALRSIIQNLNPEKYDIHLLPFYKFDKEFASPIMDKVTVEKGFGFYFRGFDKIINLVPAVLLYKLFVKDRYDLEISFQFGIPTRCFASSTNSNKICWMHTYDAKMVQGKYYKKYNEMITVAKIGRDKMLQAGFDNCDYCYNIIDEDVINKKALEGLLIQKKHKFAVVTVARMMPDKAYMRYVKCLASVLKEKKIDFEFWLIGGGSEESKVVEYIKQNCLEDQVLVLGKQNNPYKYMHKADLYFCVSYREGFSTACQEAALLGLPIISVNVDGAEEVVEEAGCGLVVGNSELGIVTALDYISENEMVIYDWRCKAEKSKTKFYKDCRIKKIEKILDENLSNYD